MSKLDRDLLRFIGWFFLANALCFVILGTTYLNSILSMGSLFANYLANYSGSLGKTLVLVFTFVNYFAYMLLLGFTPAILAWVFAIICPYRRLNWALCVLLAVISILLLFADSRVYLMFKFHLNSTILEMLFNREGAEVFDFSSQEILLFCGIGVFVLAVEILIARFVWKLVILSKRLQVGKVLFLLWMGGAFFSYFTLMLSMANNNNLFIQQTPNLPLYNQLFTYLIPDKNAAQILQRYSEQHFSQPSFPNETLKYPLHSMQFELPKMPYNIILIMVDSLRFDSLKPLYTPNLSKFASSSVQFENYMSGGNSTQPGLFSLFYSLPVNYWTAALNQAKPPILFSLLNEARYTIKIIWSMPYKSPPFDKTIFRGLTSQQILQTEGETIGDADREITRNALQFLTQEKSNQQPFFLYLFYDALHGYCKEQNFPVPFQPAHKTCLRIAFTNETDPLPYYNRYLNAARFVDGEVGQVLETIDKLGFLENSIVIITADHGQEFNDNKQNYWEHTGNFSPVQVQVPLLIHWPGRSPQQISYLTSSYDLIPTLFQNLFACKNPSEDYGVGHNLFDPAARQNFVLMGSYVNMGVYEPLRITTLETTGGVVVTDTKLTPLPMAKPIDEQVSQALILMRKYFANKSE